MDNKTVDVDPDIKKRIMAFKQCFGSEAGGEVLKDLSAYCRAKQPSFVKREGLNADPLEMAFLDGRKDIYFYIQRILDLDLPV